jgi:hypothetical protein
MKVSELIKILQTLPDDAEIQIAYGLNDDELSSILRNQWDNDFASDFEAESFEVTINNQLDMVTLCNLSYTYGMNVFTHFLVAGENAYLDKLSDFV